MNRVIDLRSDTVTQPTQEMREAMYAAQVGDDVYGDDPTVNRLEEYAAGKVGKEAALFVPSGTFGNQLALFSHCHRGMEVILGEECHIVQHEVGAASVIAGVQLRTLSGFIEESGIPALESRIRGLDIHEPGTGLICIENARSDGKVVPVENMRRIGETARKYDIPVHMDGARLFNAAAYLRCNVRDITEHCDTVMFCLSKGLCAPVGSMLAGSREFIARARKGRKLMGGGMRQAGFLAAAGLIALEKMTLRLDEDHQKALLLARELSAIPGIKANPSEVHINMVFFRMTYEKLDMKQFVREMRERGIVIHSGENGFLRFVTHNGISVEDIGYIVESMKRILKGMNLV